MSILRIFALVMLAASTSFAGVAQVFIPDQLERDWLNTLIPGIVDAGGTMDTLHPLIPTIDTTTITVVQFGVSLDLVGVAYLDSLSKLSVGGQSNVTISGFPKGLDDLDIGMDNGVMELGDLPRKMDSFGIASSNQIDLVTIHSMPDTTEYMFVTGLNAWSIDAPGYVDNLHFNFNGLPNASVLIFPSLTIRQLNFDGGVYEILDLSAATVDLLNLGIMTFATSIFWPQETTRIAVSTHLDVSGPWPETLTYLFIDNTYGFCLPWLPDGLSDLTFFSGTMPCFPNWPASLEFCVLSGIGDFNSDMVEYCSVLNSDCPGSNPGIAGRVFVDSDADGQYDTGEPGLPQTQVVLQPNGQATGCSSDGNWEIGVLPGEYTITAGSNYPYIQSIVPETQNASVPEMGDVDLGNDFAVTLIPDIQDLRVSLYTAPARPGFDNSLYLRCENYGTTPVDAQLTLAFDADQSWVGSSVAPATQSGNSASWSFPAMPIGAVQNIVIDLSTATSVALGTDIAHTLTADPIATDETPGDNTYTHQDSVVGSYDPNDKLLDPKVLSPAQVAQGATPIEYTIRFQNTGTFLAERVVILDTLSEDLQWESMRFIASSHVNHWYITDGVLHVIHNDIMLPDSTSDEAGSHGFVKFSMLPKTDLQDGATITNIAQIVFDFNEPIITPPAVFSVDVEAGITDRSAGSEFLLIPNPSHDRIQLRSDRTGVLRYRIMDVLGAQVQIGTTPANGWVNVETLPPGPYVIEVEQAEVRTSQRFMKQ